MDTAVTNLVNTYLDCVKILVSEPWPDDMEDVLHDVIRNTKTFSEQIKSRKLKSKFNKNHPLTTYKRREANKLKSRSTRSSTVTLKDLKSEGPSPVVLIARILDENNAAGANNDGAEVDNQSANEELESTTQAEDHAHASEIEIKTEFDECNRAEEDFREDEGKCSGKDDGCVIM